MKFVHIADMHFDIPFTTLNKKELGNVRRLEQRKIFKDIIEYIKEHNIEYFFIAGDLYEHEYVKKSTIEYINNLFKEIPNTKIFIAPGNHDPAIKNSYYKQFSWNSNVFIFGNKVEKIEHQNICIYGYGFEDFYMKNNKLNEISNIDKNKINILITHCNLDGQKNNETEYNPISNAELKSLNMDYIAMGHIHKKTELSNEQENAFYPGSPISMGFDEMGKHGMIAGEIDEEKKLKLEFISLDKKEFVSKIFDISNIKSEEELIEQINSIELEQNKYYKIVLVGNRNFEINLYNIEKNTYNENIIKFTNNTKIGIDLDNLKNESSLKGIFIKNILKKIEDNPEQKEKLLNILEIGLDAM